MPGATAEMLGMVWHVVLEIDDVLARDESGRDLSQVMLKLEVRKLLLRGEGICLAGD